MKKVSIFCVFFLIACGGGSTPNPNEDNFEIFVTGLNLSGFSFDKQNISLSSDNNNCRYRVNNDDLIHLSSTNNRDFSFRNPIIYSNSENFDLFLSTIPTGNCMSASKII